MAGSKKANALQQLKDTRNGVKRVIKVSKTRLDKMSVVRYLRFRCLQSDTDIPIDNHSKGEHLKTDTRTLWILDTQSKPRPLQLLEIVDGF